MRDAIGGTFMLRILIIFIVLYIVFMCFAVSYAKTFRLKNKVIDILEQQGYDPAVYTFPTVKPIDTEVIKTCAEEYELIVTCEEHNIIGGFGSAVAEVMAEMRQKQAHLLRVGLNDMYAVRVGNQKYLREQYGMSAAKIAAKIEEELNG